MQLTFRAWIFSIVLLACFAARPAYAACTSPSGVEQDMIYNKDYHTYAFCDGTSWIALSTKYLSSGGGCSTCGYFVMSQSTWNGNLGGGSASLSTIDATCLTELTTNTGWQGYAD